jgi:hypothetical protein
MTCGCGVPYFPSPKRLKTVADQEPFPKGYDSLPEAKRAALSQRHVDRPSDG